ncbi:hypothetical protein ADICYQ_2845 [Cyclobacterium qasimii M12-11B]|uniref:Uncharacterized protein n=1 Tax=Cyclobacterium qasimii M12-11B TaxID=641524 RepID=S7VD09_9BACT|nr:hypothetical protein ADICYQ_2845 [Cyclobacterium qasimii M12-11B]
MFFKATYLQRWKVGKSFQIENKIKKIYLLEINYPLKY